MSDLTKQKISENSKKFSICKLCSKQCRGFRGLVDHMHQDHRDHRPWKCHLCDERTAFVKTLYRHLRQCHNVFGSPCQVCGKFYSRAQSMLHHVNKVRGSLQNRKVWIFSTSPGPPPLKCGKFQEILWSKGSKTGKKHQTHPFSTLLKKTPLVWKKSTLFIFF